MVTCFPLLLYQYFFRLHLLHLSVLCYIFAVESSITIARSGDTRTAGRQFQLLTKQFRTRTLCFRCAQCNQYQLIRTEILSPQLLIMQELSFLFSSKPVQSECPGREGKAIARACSVFLHQE
jgi:hypothetical protein